MLFFLLQDIFNICLESYNDKRYFGFLSCNFKGSDHNFVDLFHNF